MKTGPIEERMRLAHLTDILKGRSFAEACRTYVLKTREPQYLGIQPIERNEYVDGRHEHYFQKAVKRFPGDDPAERHCCTREELISEAARTTGRSEAEARIFLHRLFAFQPELTYCERGAVCKKDSVPGFASSDIKLAAIPYDSLKKDLPDEWYISLQIPEHIVAKMVWGCRKTGSLKPHPCSSRFAERLLRLYKRRRGEFIRRHSFAAASHSSNDADPLSSNMFSPFNPAGYRHC